MFASPAGPEMAAMVGAPVVAAPVISIQLTMVVT
jgi:hypothetical protein